MQLEYAFDKGASQVKSLCPSLLWDILLLSNTGVFSCFYCMNWCVHQDGKYYLTDIFTIFHTNYYPLRLLIMATHTLKLHFIIWHIHYREMTWGLSWCKVSKNSTLHCPVCDLPKVEPVMWALKDFQYYLVWPRPLQCLCWKENLSKHNFQWEGVEVAFISNYLLHLIITLMIAWGTVPTMSKSQFLPWHYRLGELDHQQYPR